MNIDIYTWEGRDGFGNIGAVRAVAKILFSPNDGFDADKLAALENELGELITSRLNESIKVRKDNHDN